MTDYSDDFVHGALTAWVALQQQVDPSALAAHVGQDASALSGVANEIAESIADPMLGFTPKLSHDPEQSIGAATQDFAHWCEGFLYGVGTAGVDTTGWSRDAKSFLTDLTRITRVDAQAAEDTDGAAYLELIEYVRMGVLMLNDIRFDDQSDA